MRQCPQHLATEGAEVKAWAEGKADAMQGHVQVQRGSGRAEPMPEALGNNSGMAHGHFVPEVVKQRSGRAEI